jgi:hypothetical protein
MEKEIRIFTNKAKFVWPNYQQSGGMGPGDLLFIHDNISGQQIMEIIDHYGKPGALISDLYSTAEFALDIPVYCCSLRTAMAEQQLQDSSRPTTVSTQHTANFMVNKKQINRFLCMKFVRLFGIDADYTWSGSGRSEDLGTILRELGGQLLPLFDAETRSKLLSPLDYEPRWIDITGQTPSDAGLDNYGANSRVWDSAVRDIFFNSAVALITESTAYDRVSLFTEKTLFALAGLNFPIWIGAYNQAQVLQSWGFDVFDDIIDHSYQNKPTLIERCFRAFQDNAELLQDKPKTLALRQQHLPRLLANRDLAFSGIFRKHCHSQAGSWPLAIKKAICPTIFRYYHMDWPC